MRRANDTRLWFDKADGKTVYGVFQDQRFYSSEYTGPDDERLQLEFIRQLVEKYSEWCQYNYLAVRAGNDPVPLPAELLMVTNRMEEDLPNGETQETEAQPDEEEGEEGGVS